MAEFTVLEENPISITELKSRLATIEEEGTLSFRGEKTKQYLENFAKTEMKDLEKVREEIKALNIPRLKDRHIIKILDVMPTDLDSIKMLLSGETLTISDEDLKKIINVIPQ